MASPDFIGATPNAWLEAGDVLGLQTLGSFADLKFNGLALAKRLVPIRLYGGVMYEDVLAGLALDEPVAFAGVEPLYCSLFFHFYSSCLSYLVLLVPLWVPLARKNKKLQVYPCSPVERVKRNHKSIKRNDILSHTTAPVQ